MTMMPTRAVEIPHEDEDVGGFRTYAAMLQRVAPFPPLGIRIVMEPSKRLEEWLANTIPCRAIPQDVRRICYHCAATVIAVRTGHLSAEKEILQTPSRSGDDTPHQTLLPQT